MSNGDDDDHCDTPILGVHDLSAASADEVDRFQARREAARQRSFYRGFNATEGASQAIIRRSPRTLQPQAASANTQRSRPEDVNRCISAQLSHMNDRELIAWSQKNRAMILDHALDFVSWPVMSDPDDPFVSQFPALRERVLVLAALRESPVLNAVQKQRVALALDAARYLCSGQA